MGLNGSFYILPSVQFSSVTQSCPTHWDPVDRTTSGFLVHHQLLGFAQTHVHGASNDIQPSHSLSSLLLLPSVFPSIRVFYSELALHTRWPKYWSFSFSISPFNEYSGMIPIRINWFDLAIQGNLKSLLQHSLKASVLQCSAFFII